MSAGLRHDDPRKGWCPGALRPMAAADGLIVRLRLTGGILPAVTAHALANLAERHGNGRFDLSARANLQMRGIGETTLPALHDALRDLGLLDHDADAEAVRNVIASPLAGLHPGLDIRQLVAALEGRLVGTPALRDLPTKFGFLVDDGGEPSLADIAADVRFDWCVDASAFAVGLGGTRDGALAIGWCDADELVDRAEALARRALALFARWPEARRMKGLVRCARAELLSPLAGEGGLAKRGRTRAFQEKVAMATSALSPRSLIRPDFVGPPSPASGRRDAVATLATPYGRFDAPMLRVAADLATDAGELRLTPWRSLLVPGATDKARARAAGFIVDPDDPRLAVAACVGAPDCARATTATREDADALAGLAAAFPGDLVRLHVSGCAKGCAKPSSSSVTLVGRDGRYDLVPDGRPGDPPMMIGLDLAAARAAIAGLLAT